MTRGQHATRARGPLGDGAACVHRMRSRTCPGVASAAASSGAEFSAPRSQAATASCAGPPMTCKRGHAGRRGGVPPQGARRWKPLLERAPGLRVPRAGRVGQHHRSGHQPSENRRPSPVWPFRRGNRGAGAIAAARKASGSATVQASCRLNSKAVRGQLGAVAGEQNHDCGKTTVNDQSRYCDDCATIGRKSDHSDSPRGRSGAQGLNAND
jgi:hypothetical protein